MFTDLVLHLLAHVSAPGPESLFDPRYVSWAEGVTPTGVRSRLHADAQMLARGWTALDGLAVQALPDLHSDWPTFLATRGRALGDVRSEDVARPNVLCTLHGCTPWWIELVHAQLALLAPWFAGVHGTVIESSFRAIRTEVDDWLGAANEMIPSLANERIELAWSLGPRGRVLPERIVIGMPAPWNEITPATPAVLALHEHLVRRSGVLDWAGAEWTALVSLARRMQSAPAVLRSAHAAWVASLDLGSLVTTLLDRAALDRNLGGQLLNQPRARAALLATPP